MASLTLLESSHGFIAGDLDTSGYVAVTPAYQKIYFADGRTPDNKGFHKLDFINTKITKQATVAFIKGEVVTQTGGAKGIYDECLDVKLTGSLTGTFVVGELVTQAVSGASGFVAYIGSGYINVYPIGKDEDGQPIAFVTSQLITGTPSGATTTPSAVSSSGEGMFHFIYRTTTVEFDTTNTITGSDSGATLTSTLVVTAPPHWLPWVLTVGKFPDGGSNIMALCFGRIFMNSISNPHHWLATRAGDPLDMEMSQDDVGTAVSSQTSKAGLVGDQLVALVPYKDNYLIFGCLNEMWVLRSDPVAGGVLTNISKETGVFSNTAWCWDDKNNLYFVGMDGIYVLNSEAIINASSPTNLTKERIPKLVSSLALNRRTDRITMAYDKERYGLNATISQQDGAWSVSFFVNLRPINVGGVEITGGVFPEVYQTEHIPASMSFFNSRTKEQRGLLFGCYDGYIRKFDDTEMSDDGDNAINSFVTIGPISNSEKGKSSVKVSDISVVPGVDTDSITLEVFSGDSSEELIDKIMNEENPTVSKVLTGDKSLPSLRNKVIGSAIGIKLSNNNVDETWNIEKINAEINILGGK
jgi:hypothetical protein